MAMKGVFMATLLMAGLVLRTQAFYTKGGDVIRLRKTSDLKIVSNSNFLWMIGVYSIAVLCSARRPCA